MVGGVCNLLPHGICICHYAFLYYLYKISCYCFCFFKKNLVLINRMEWLMIPACSSLICILNNGNTEGTISLTICV